MENILKTNKILSIKNHDNRENTKNSMTPPSTIFRTDKNFKNQKKGKNNNEEVNR